MRWVRVGARALLVLWGVLCLGLTLVRLRDPVSGAGIRLESFTPLGVPLYAALLLGVVAWAWPDRRRRAWVARAPRAGLALHLWWLAPLYTGPDPPPASDSPHLVVMTANLRLGQADAPSLVSAATSAHVEILALEEVTPEALTRLRAAGLFELLPYDAGQPAPSSGGTMIFGRQPMTDLQRVPLAFGSWTARTEGLTVMVVHPATPVTPTQWREDHLTLDAQAGARHPDLLMGDFNATLDHAPMRRLSTLGLRSAAELANQGWQPTWPSNGLFRVLGVPFPPFAQIDHVFVGPRLAALSSRTVSIPGTDHRALVATVALK